MKKIIFAIAIVALFIGSATLSAGGNFTDEKNQNQLSTIKNKTFLRADLSFDEEENLKFESMFSIGKVIYFGVKITGTVQNRVHIAPFQRIGWLFGLDFDVEPGTTIEITCPVLRIIAGMDIENSLDMWCRGHIIQYKEL